MAQLTSINILFCLIFHLCVGLASAQTPNHEPSKKAIEIAALEHIRDSEESSSTTMSVRLLFRKKEDGWVAFPHQADNPDELAALWPTFKGQRNWIEVYQGRKLSHVTSDLLQPFKYYSTVGYQQLVGTSKIREQAPSNEGYEYGPLHPHVLLTHPISYSIKDPDGWTTCTGTHLTPLIEILIAGRLAEVDIGLNMSMLSSTGIQERIKLQIDQSFKSNKGKLLLKVSATFRDQILWVVQPPSASPRFLSSGFYNGADDCMEYPVMRLLDYGDYDGDGACEFIFALYGDDYGGYRLFWDDFRKSATFDWIYH